MLVDSRKWTGDTSKRCRGCTAFWVVGILYIVATIWVKF